MQGVYCLAMYDVRSKQQYIFRKDKIKEIVGGSAIIRDCFEKDLIMAADVYAKENGYEKGIVRNQEFKTEEFKDAVNNRKILGEVIYDGGGNFYCLYDSVETCKGVNRIFTRELLKDKQTLKVLCSYKEIDNFDDYNADQKELRKIHDRQEAYNAPVLPALTFPFTQIDARTSLPIYSTIRVAKQEIQVSKESFAKYSKYESERASGKFKDNEVELDKIANNEDDSLLAVIFIDGNSMGARVAEILPKDQKVDYETAIRKLRDFSSDIHKNFVVDRVKDINDFINNKNTDGAKRFVVAAGDETSFICKAEEAMNLVRTYFDGLIATNENTSGGPMNSACAGICIFHSHSPYAEAYRIAEECCESAKKLMKQADITNACLVDFHYCQSGFGVDLETIRENEVGDIISKPWLYWLGPDEKKDKLDELTYTDYSQVLDMVRQLQKTARTNVKSLLGSARNSQAEFEKELDRIIAHSSDDRRPDFAAVEPDKDKKRKLIYDIITVYDLWFKEV